jgi:putative nucleotidyltransferase with HDIG domain
MIPASSLAVVSETGKPSTDVARLTRHLHRLEPFAFNRLETAPIFPNDLIVADVESLDDLALAEAADHLRRLKTEQQPMILVCGRTQLARLSRVGLLKGNNAVTRPLDSDNFTDLIDSLISLQRIEYSPQKPAVEARPVADPVSENAPQPDPINDLNQSITDRAVKTLSTVLDAVFSLSSAGAKVTQNDLGKATDLVSGAIDQLGLGGWVETVRSHHSGTYQHCLLVAGTTIAFGKHFGFSDRDMRRVTAAALVHDVGKTAIPESILDKPTALTSAEMDLIRTHTVVGFDIMRKIEGFDAEMSDMVLSHHEFLDGSGYPNGLMNGQIGDLVRVITIADVFSALVEARAYKPAMSGLKAYSIMRGMVGKLDMPLVKAQEKIMIAA